MTVRVVIAEDEAIIRLDLKETLEEEGYEVVGETGRGDEAVAMVKAHGPDSLIRESEIGARASCPTPVFLPGHMSRRDETGVFPGNCF